MSDKKQTKIVDFSGEDPTRVKAKQMLCTECWLWKPAAGFEDAGDVCEDCRS